MGNKPIVFVVTPFEDDFIALYDSLKIEFEEHYVFTNAGDLDNQQNILSDIVKGIYEADIIIADLTGLNPNVFYELGLAHALGKKVIIITQSISELPFDIKSYRANGYSMQFNKVPELYEKLEKLLSGAMDGSIQFGNPVSDYIPKSKESSNIICDDLPNNLNIANEDMEEDKGFLDYIADIEEVMAEITCEIDGMFLDLNELMISIDNETMDINKVSSAGGASTVTFARNIARKISKPIDNFALKLKGHIKIVSEKWLITENDYLALLDSCFIYSNENIAGLKESIKSLKELQVAILDSDQKAESFQDSLQTCMGLERRLNRALTTLSEDMQNYLSMTDMMSSSIDRIEAKSLIVIDKISVSISEK